MTTPDDDSAVAPDATERPCYVCGAATVVEKCKVVCTRCRAINENCAGD